MASNKANGNGVITPDTTACTCYKSAKDSRDAADSSKTANETALESKEIVKGYKICCLDRARETHEVYQDIMSCIALGNYKETTIVQTNVNEYIKKDEEIEKLINDSSKLLSDLCNALNEANRVACDMKTKILSKLNKCSKPDIKTITDQLDDITEKTNDLSLKGVNAYESVVAIAGVQTFTNTESLEDFVSLLMEAITLFKDCVEANISSTSEEVTTSREELNTCVEEIAQIMCDGKSNGTEVQGWNEVIEFLCEDPCDVDCLDVCSYFDEYCKSNNVPIGKKEQKASVDQN